MVPSVYSKRSYRVNSSVVVVVLPVTEGITAVESNFLC